jgi:hypothetical protein
VNLRSRSDSAHRTRAPTSPDEPAPTAPQRHVRARLPFESTGRRFWRAPARGLCVVLCGSGTTRQTLSGRSRRVSRRPTELSSVCRCRFGLFCSRSWVRFTHSPSGSQREAEHLHEVGVAYRSFGRARGSASGKLPLPPGRHPGHEQLRFGSAKCRQVTVGLALVPTVRSRRASGSRFVRYA